MYFSSAFVLASLYLSAANAYWLMGTDFLTSQRLDPIVMNNKNLVSGHLHSVLGGSNFGFEVSTAKLRESECTSMPVKEDFSNYWFPHSFFQHSDGSFTALGGGSVVYYLFPDDGNATAFPDDFRMIAGDPTLRSYDPNSKAQQAVSFLCLDFEGETTRHEGFPVGKSCPSGIRAQINFPSCWDGKNVDSPDHKSHVAYPSEGPDKGECSDPKFPHRLVRIFLEVYWSGEFNDRRNEALNPDQPYVLAYGDPHGFGMHADFYNGWKEGVLQDAIQRCNCNPYGDPTCCADKGIFTFDSKNEKHCKITRSIDEEVTGRLEALPGNNPVQYGPEKAKMYTSTEVKDILSPVYVYYNNEKTQEGTPIDNPSPFFVYGDGGSLPEDGNDSGNGDSGESVTPPDPTPTTTENNDDPSNTGEPSATSSDGEEVTLPTVTNSDEGTAPAPTGINNGSSGGVDEGSDDKVETTSSVSPSATVAPTRTPGNGKTCGKKLKRSRLSRGKAIKKRALRHHRKRLASRMSYD